MIWNIQSCTEMGFGLQNAKCKTKQAIILLAKNITNYYSSYGLFAKSNRLLLINLWSTCWTSQSNYSCGSGHKLLFYLWYTCKTKQTITLFVGYSLVVLLCVLFVIWDEIWNCKVSGQHFAYTTLLVKLGVW